LHDVSSFDFTDARYVYPQRDGQAELDLFTLCFSGSYGFLWVPMGLLIKVSELQKRIAEVYCWD